MSTVGGYLKYHGGRSVPWGDFHDTCEGYHQYRGGVQYCGGYHLLLFEYRGISMIHVDDMMSTVEVLK